MEKQDYTSKRNEVNNNVGETYVEFLIKDSINQSKFKEINTGLVFKYLREQYLQKIKKIQDSQKKIFVNRKLKKYIGMD